MSCTPFVNFSACEKSTKKLQYLDFTLNIYITNSQVAFDIKTHSSESRGQGGSTLRRPLDERT